MDPPDTPHRSISFDRRRSDYPNHSSRSPSLVSRDLQREPQRLHQNVPPSRDHSSRSPSLTSRDLQREPQRPHQNAPPSRDHSSRSPSLTSRNLQREPQRLHQNAPPSRDHSSRSPSITSRDLQREPQRPHKNAPPSRDVPNAFKPAIVSELKQRMSTSGAPNDPSLHQKVQHWIENNDTQLPAINIVSDDPVSEKGENGFPPKSFPVTSETLVSERTTELKTEDGMTSDDTISMPSDDHTTKILDQNLWDQFQMVPRENMETDPRFGTFLQGLKLIAYVVIFVFVLACACVNKLSLLTMASGVVKNLKQGQANPTNVMLLMGLCFPYIFWFLTYSARSLFGNIGWPTFKMTFTVLMLETFHTVGICLMLFRILPEVDMIRAILLMSSILVVPSMCKTISSTVEQSSSWLIRFFSSLASLLAFIIQMGSVALCTLSGVMYSESERTAISAKLPSSGDTVMRGNVVFWGKISWEIPVSLIMVSVMTWENFINQDFNLCGLRLPFTIWKKNLHLLRQRLYIFVSVWKIGVSILFALLFSKDFQFNLMFPSTNNSTTSPSSAEELHFQEYGPLYAHLVSSIMCSYLGSLACKMCMQRFSFSLPLTLVTPVCTAVVVLQCQYDFIPFPGEAYTWVCPADNDPWLMYHLILIGLAWLSQIVVTAHVWFPGSSRMAKIERLFITPLRCNIFTDQFLLLRRRLDDRDRLLLSNWEAESVVDEDLQKPDAAIPLIYACATMWHETIEEMTLLLKSIFRIDIDHSARYLAQKYYGIKDPDYYEFEAHIFFDDAMELTDDDKMVPNSYVCDLMSCIDDALSSVHERQISLGPPTRIPTPYGGRLTWSLPGGTNLTVHMKDKAKIRHKKRWSQVMYMYYLLGYRILAEPQSSLDDEYGESKAPIPQEKVRLTPAQLRRRRRCAHFTRSVIFDNVSEDVQTRAENTFILALDGDVDFRPDAVRLLVDRMRKNKKVGAACGRIHPTGNGPMIWYQVFEYAIGHWLQKSTEHVFGCVLCAPGCFTLFRGSALMDDNMARTYARRSTQAGHYVQYDQGEDRWLSTLLIQQGYRIDYCAAADAFTHAPETFSEFFNQRRRWGPSTVANIIDLLRTWKSAVKVNDNLSSPYIFYQVALLVSTVLGPATVLLMMAGAYSVVFKTSIVQSHILSLIPAILYIFVCIYSKSNTQLMIGAFLSAIYSIMMTVVLVGTVRTAIDGTITSPNVVFLIMLAVIFIISAVMHPEEFDCILPGLLYFICIPASYLVLNIYFLCNLNVVSWGTREAPKKKTKEDLEREKQEQEQKKNKKLAKKGILGWLGVRNIISEFGNIFKELKSMIHESFKMNANPQKKKTDHLLEELIIEIRRDRLGDRASQFSLERSTAMTAQSADIEPMEVRQLEVETEAEVVSQSEPSTESAVGRIPTWLKKEDPNNPGWLSSTEIGDGPLVNVDEKEHAFWLQLIKKYLHPLVEDQEHRDKMSADLKSLRNNVVFGFFMVTALWVAFFLQFEVLQDELKDFLFIKIPRLDSNSDPLTFQPFGLAFFAFFAVIILFQFIGMLFHRWGTILHVLSITSISLGQTFTEKDKVKDIIQKVADLQRMRDIEYEPEPDYDEPLPDYEGENDDSGSSSDTSIPGRPPPSYHTQDIPARDLDRRTQGRRNSQVFNRYGQPTGHALQTAFEKRYRNEIGRGRGFADQRYDSVVNVPSSYPEPNFAHY